MKPILALAILGLLLIASSVSALEITDCAQLTGFSSKMNYTLAFGLDCSGYCSCECPTTTTTLISANANTTTTTLCTPTWFCDLYRTTSSTLPVFVPIGGDEPTIFTPLVNVVDNVNSAINELSEQFRWPVTFALLGLFMIVLVLVYYEVRKMYFKFKRKIK